MKILDPQGRFFGWLSVVDLLILFFLGCLAPLFPFGLRILRPLPPRITAVEPGRVAPGDSLRITGSGFKYGAQAAVGDLPALSTEYYGSDLLIAYLSPDLAPGQHRVRVKNLRGDSTLWERTLEVADPGLRPQIPVMLTCGFTDLTAEEAELLVEAALQEKEGPLQEGPRIVRILKRGPMALWSTKNADPSKEFVIADVAVLAEIAEIPEGKRYFYRNQILRFDFPVRLPVRGRLFTGVIHREPDPTRPEVGGPHG